MDTLPRGSPYPQDIQSVFDAIDDGPLLDRLNEYRWTGRKGYSPESMWRACLVRYLLRLRYVRDLIAQLKASRPLRRLCGFRDAVPSEGTFSRFIARLVCHQDLVNQAIDDASARVGDALTKLHDAGDLPDKAPVPGSQVSIDSTDVPAYGNPRREKLADPDATWGHRTPKVQHGRRRRNVLRLQAPRRLRRLLRHPSCVVCCPPTPTTPRNCRP